MIITVMQEVSKWGKIYTMHRPFSLTVPDWLAKKHADLLEDEMYYRTETDKAILLLNSEFEEVWLPKSRISTMDIITTHEDDDLHPTVPDEDFF